MMELGERELKWWNWLIGNGAYTGCLHTPQSFLHSSFPSSLPPPAHISQSMSGQIDELLSPYKYILKKHPTKRPFLFLVTQYINVKHSGTLCRTFQWTEQILLRAKSHLTSEGTPRVSLASVNAKTWTPGTDHTWVKVVLVDDPGD